MEEDTQTCVSRMLDEFRDRANVKKPRISEFPVLETSKPYSFSKSDNLNKKPFDETVLNLNNSLIKKRLRKSYDDSVDSENECNTSVGTPWETQHMRSELSQARAQIKVLENRISQLNGFQNIARALSEQEKAAYKSDLEKERNTVRELERRVKILRRREEKVRDELSQAMESLNRERTELESKSIDLYEETSKLKEKLSEAEDSVRSLEIKAKESENARSKLEVKLKLLQEHVNTLTDQVEKLRKATREAEEAKAQLSCANLKIKELESELKSEAETSSIVKAQQAKLLKYTELERQLKQLIQQNTKLKENLNNTVFLESLVEEIKGKSKGLEERERELKATRVELGLVKNRLDEYRKVYEEVLGRSNDINNVTPHKLLEYIRQVQERNLSEKEQRLQLANNLKRLEETKELTTAECSKLKEELAAMKEELDNCNKNFKRLKKQNALITWERNDLRSLVDSCQKEMTIGGVQADSRVEALEKLVEGYRKKLQQLEADPSLISSSLVVGNEKNNSNSAELDKLKEENEKLTKTIDDLKYELEHRALKGDFNTQNTRILHFKLNPTSVAMDERNCVIEKLEKEVLQLRERLRLMEEGNVNDLTQNVQANVNSETAKELKEFREKVKRLEMQNQRLKEAFKTTGHEFREAIYALLGYKVDALPNKMYRLSSLYADSQDQHLLFKMNNSGGMELLETEFSKTLSDLMESVLVIHHSIPIFLSSLTLDLFKRQTASFAPSTIMEV